MSTSAKFLLSKKLAGLGADGLCNPDAECGCGLDDLAPFGDCINLDECFAARWTIPKKGEPEYEDEDRRDGYFKVIEP